MINVKYEDNSTVEYTCIEDAIDGMQMSPVLPMEIDSGDTSPVTKCDHDKYTIYDFEEFEYMCVWIPDEHATEYVLNTSVVYAQGHVVVGLDEVNNVIEELK